MNFSGSTRFPTIRFLTLSLTIGYVALLDIEPWTPLIAAGDLGPVYSGFLRTLYGGRLRRLIESA